jgi:hypothetical protein
MALTPNPNETNNITGIGFMQAINVTLTFKGKVLSMYENNSNITLYF